MFPGAAVALGGRAYPCWMTRWRRLVRDHEKCMDVSDAMIHLGTDALLLRRVAHPNRQPFTNGHYDLSELPGAGPKLDFGHLRRL